MKRIISITIALCLVFCSVLPVYAEAWTSQQASSVTQSVIGILTSIVNNGIGFTEWATLLGNGNAPAYYHSFQDLYNRIDWALAWIVPDTLHTSSDPTIMDSLIVLTNYAMNHLPAISSIASYVSSWMSSNNSYLNKLVLTMANARFSGLGINDWGYDKWNVNAHAFLGTVYPGENNTYNPYSFYTIPVIYDNGTTGVSGYRWDDGTPIGNLAVGLWTLAHNQVNNHQSRWLADLKHYNDNLTTWDSQGSTLTQVGFTPESAIQGLYRYLAFTQRDVARLAYVFANDEELEARELAQANQEQVLDDFIDPTGAGAVSTTDLRSMADASGSFKDNFYTGQSASGIWNVFDRDYDWFSQTTANNLQPSLTRGVEEYSTPYLDEYYKELESILEVNKRD